MVRLLTESTCVLPLWGLCSTFTIHIHAVHERGGTAISVEDPDGGSPWVSLIFLLSTNNFAGIASRSSGHERYSGQIYGLSDIAEGMMLDPSYPYHAGILAVLSLSEP
jgi:hypothetical protein